MIDNKIENFFPSGIVYIGYVLLFFSVIVLFSDIKVFISLLIIGSVLSFTINGIQLDSSKRMYLVYTRVLGVKLGKWKSLKKYSCLSILTRTLAQKVYSRGQAEASFSNKYYEVYLLSENHRLKLLVCRFKNEKSAKDEIKLLEKEFMMITEIYSPS